MKSWFTSASVPHRFELSSDVRLKLKIKKSESKIRIKNQNQKSESKIRIKDQNQRSESKIRIKNLIEMR